MKSLFLLAFGEEEFLAPLTIAGSEVFFNKLLVELPDNETWLADSQRYFLEIHASNF